MRWTVTAIVIAILAISTGQTGVWAGSAGPFPDSEWTTPLPHDAPRHPLSDEIIEFIAQDNDLDGCITLSGTPADAWGMPIFTATSDDPVYDVTTRRWAVPDEFSALRIPSGAAPADNEDGEMVLYDPDAGYVAQLSKAEYDEDADLWEVGGGSIAYLGSNGLYGSVLGSDDPRNGGSYRGYSGAVSAVHYDDVAAGSITRAHVISVNSSADQHIYPFTGTDGDLQTSIAPRQGSRIRIKPSVDVGSLGLSAQAETIARGIQEFGLLVGDTSGGAVVLKLEDTELSGRAETWDLDRTSLCAIGAEHLEVILTAFGDVEDSPFHADISVLLRERISFGCGGWDYCPRDSVTRGQFAAFLNRALDLPDATGSDRFVDDDGSVFEADIEAIAAAGITLGCGQSGQRFCPDDPVTRGQMAALLVRALGYTDDGGGDLFVDDQHSIFEADIDRLAAAGVTLGCNPPDNDRYCPDDLVERGQMAAFLNRALYQP